MTAAIPIATLPAADAAAEARSVLDLTGLDAGRPRDSTPSR